MDGEFESSPKYRRILIVDDDEKLLRDLSQRLTRAHYDVVTRSSAIGASAILLSEEFDYVLLDVLMPGLRPEAAVRLIERPTRHKTRLILLTKLTTEEMRPLLVASHAIGAIEKNLSSSAFVLAFERCVRKADRDESELLGQHFIGTELREPDERVSSILSAKPPSSRVLRKQTGETLSQRLEKLFAGRSR